jgi:Dna[CI] antecedent, DciA
MRAGMTQSCRPLTPLPDLIAGIIKTHGFQSRMVEFTLQQQWGAIVGPHIAGHTYPESIRHRKLFLLAETSVWMQQLLFLKSEILGKITEVVGEDVLTDIVLRVGVAPVPVTDPIEIDGEATSADPAGTPRDFSASIEESLGGVQNDILLERLRALFHKAAASHVSSSRVASEKVYAGD